MVLNIMGFYNEPVTQPGLAHTVCAFVVAHVHLHYVTVKRFGSDYSLNGTVQDVFISLPVCDYELNIVNASMLACRH